MAWEVSRSFGNSSSEVTVPPLTLSPSSFSVLPLGLGLSSCSWSILSVSIYPLALDLSSHSQSCLCCYCCCCTTFPCTREFPTVGSLSFMAGECRIQVSFFLLIFTCSKNFISLLASRSQSIRSSRMPLSTHYAKTLHPISLIIV